MTELDRWLDRVHCGDCLDVLRELPDCSVDLCATDPPFGIAFMSKTWDSDIPARAIWAEVLRVLKPGASCFVCAGSRQDTILGMLLDLREVGFDIQHAALSWVYWNGFPKSTDVGKDLDKAAFLAWLREVPDGETETRQELMGWDAADVRKAASAAVNGAYSAEPVNSAACPEKMLRFNGDNLRPCQNEYGTGTGTLLLAALQARFGDAPGVRQKAADYMAPRQVEKGTYRSEWTESIGGDSTGAFCTSGELTKHSTSPSTPEAIEWDGWHSGSVPLKPSAEQILWVTKPAEPGPARNNVLKWGVGAVNIGECRVPIVGDDIINTATHSAERHNASPCYGDSSADWTTQQHPSGRYPSNLLVSARALGDDSKYGDLDAWARERGLSDEWLDAALSAGVLRVPKPSRAEKNAGLDSPKRVCYDEASKEAPSWESADHDLPTHRELATSQAKDTIESTSGTPQQRRASLCSNTCLSGKKPTDQCHQGTACTISTETKPTTDLKTCSLSPSSNTSESTPDAIKTIAELGGSIAGCAGSPSRSTPGTTPERTASARGAKRAASRTPSETSGCVRPEPEPLKASHPTCKPVTLMAFLCTLACPRGGVVLDPFIGSGTTGVAARQCGMHYIGIEREPEYVAIAEARIAAAIRDHQPTLAI